VRARYNIKMSAVLFRLLWILVISSVVAYGTYIVIGSAIKAEAGADLKRIVARDVIDQGAHHLSGMVFVPNGCYELSVRTEELPGKVQHVAFSTWEAPYTECTLESVPRAFTTVVFETSADVEFIATVDGEPVPFVVTPVSKRRI